MVFIKSQSFVITGVAIAKDCRKSEETHHEPLEVAYRLLPMLFGNYAGYFKIGKEEENADPTP